MKSIVFSIIMIILLTGCLNQKTKDKESDQVSETVKETETIPEEVLDHTPVFQFDYLGEVPPDSVPKVFARDIISTGVDESCFGVSISGEEIIFSRDGSIYHMVKGPEGWSDPDVISFSGKEIDGECCFSPDGQKILFASRRPLPGSSTALNTWMSQKEDNGWSEAIAMSLPAKDQTVHAVSVSNNGNIYFDGIKKMRYENGQYLEPKNLIPEIRGSHPFIAPDESYIIFNARAPGSRAPDLYISFMGTDSLWSQPIRLDNHINTEGLETNAFVTPDGKYMFFTRKFDIYWVSAGFIERLRPMY